MILNAQQIAQYAAAAGFSGNNLNMAVAIAQAESGGNTTAISSAGDVGLWQINIPAHPQYSQSYLQDPMNNARVAFSISQGGNSWRLWCTAYSDAACGTRGGTYLGAGSPYQKYLANQSNAPVGRWNPAYLKDMTAWIANPSMWMYGRWNQPASAMEGGVDLGSPGGTPVLALADGAIIGAGNFWHSANLYTPNSGPPGYGVVTTRINVPGYGMQDLYYQHISISPSIKTCYANNCGGQSVKKGQVIGTIIPGVNMLEMGFNANWGGVWGVNHPGQWANDPRPMIKALMDAGPPGTSSTGGITGITLGTTTGQTPTYTPLTQQVHETLVAAPGFYPIALALDEAEQFPGWVDLTTPMSVNVAGTSVSVPDFIGLARSIGATVSDNFVPFAIRSGLIILGLFIVFSLIAKTISGPVMQMAPELLSAVA